MKWAKFLKKLFNNTPKAAVNASEAQALQQQQLYFNAQKLHREYSETSMLSDETTISAGIELICMIRKHNLDPRLIADNLDVGSLEQDVKSLQIKKLRTEIREFVQGCNSCELLYCFPNLIIKPMKNLGVSFGDLFPDSSITEETFNQAVANAYIKFARAYFKDAIEGDLESFKSIYHFLGLAGASSDVLDPSGSKTAEEMDDYLQELKTGFQRKWERTVKGLYKEHVPKTQMRE